MEIDKLIKRLKSLHNALKEEGEQKCSPEINTVAFVLQAAATSLSTLQAETEKLQSELEKVKKALAMMWFAYVPPISFWNQNSFSATDRKSVV